MALYIEAFILGNGAILTNVCLLPLYPGLIAFLAGNASNERTKAATPWLGIFVLAGILTTMTLVGLLLYLLKSSFSTLLPWLLPLTYGLVIVLGLLLLLGINPFYRFSSGQAPIVSNPYLSAYFYGCLLAPMTLPCTGPIILSAFVLGASSSLALANELTFFLVFGIGFGWPLIILPLLAAPVQRRSVKWLTNNHKLLTRISGLLLVGIGLFGVWTELF